MERHARRSSRGWKILRIGAWWHVLGCGPLYLVILATYIGLAPRDVNPIGFGILAFLSFLPSIAVMTVGLLMHRGAGRDAGRFPGGRT